MKFRDLLLIVSLVVMVVHSSSFLGAYVHDDWGIVNDPRYADFWAFKWWNPTNRPVGGISLAVQIATLGTSTVASHFVNLVIHVGAVIGLVFLLDLIVRHRAPDWESSHRLTFVAGAALLWAVHPITTTTVTYIIQRYESLAALGMIWSTFFWLRAYTRCERVDGEVVRVTASDAPHKVFWLASLAAACFAYDPRSPRQAYRSFWRLGSRRFANKLERLRQALAWSGDPDDTDPARNLPAPAELDSTE